MPCPLWSFKGPLLNTSSLSHSYDDDRSVAISNKDMTIITWPPFRFKQHHFSAELTVPAPQWSRNAEYYRVKFLIKFHVQSMTQKSIHMVSIGFGMSSVTSIEFATFPRLIILLSKMYDTVSMWTSLSGTVPVFNKREITRQNFAWFSSDVGTWHSRFFLQTFNVTKVLLEKIL